MKRLSALLVVMLVVSFTWGAAPVIAEEDPQLYALGVVSASNLYFSYLVLGTVADGFAAGGYGEDIATRLTNETIALTRSSTDALQALLDTGSVAGDDFNVVVGLIETHRLLLGQANGLLRYINDPAQTGDFLRYRDLAWEQISALLNF